MTTRRRSARDESVEARPVRRPHRALWLLPVLLLADAAHAQGPDLNQLALHWIRGRFASPVVCQTDDRLARTFRRMVIQPGPKASRPAVDKLSFHGFDAPHATRCMDVLGAEQPEIHGSIQVTLPSVSRSDLARSDFQRTLRHEGGFDFAVTTGRLRLTGWGETRESRLVDFKGGTARFRNVPRGSDAARILSDFDSPQKLTLDLSAPTGETLHFPLVLYDDR